VQRAHVAGLCPSLSSLALLPWCAPALLCALPGFPRVVSATGGAGNEPDEYEGEGDDPAPPPTGEEADHLREQVSVVRWRTQATHRWCGWRYTVVRGGHGRGAILGTAGAVAAAWIASPIYSSSGREIHSSSHDSSNSVSNSSNIRASKRQQRHNKGFPMGVSASGDREAAAAMFALYDIHWSSPCNRSFLIPSPSAPIPPPSFPLPSCSIPSLQLCSRTAFSPLQMLAEL